MKKLQDCFRTTSIEATFAGSWTMIKYDFMLGIRLSVLLHEEDQVRKTKRSWKEPNKIIRHIRHSRML